MTRGNVSNPAAMSRLPREIDGVPVEIHPNAVCLGILRILSPTSLGNEHGTRNAAVERHQLCVMGTGQLQQMTIREIGRLFDVFGHSVSAQAIRPKFCFDRTGGL